VQADVLGSDRPGYGRAHSSGRQGQWGTSEYVRFQRPGHRVTGDRSSQDRRHRDGVDYVHAIIDDHTRLAYAEIHLDQRATTVAALLERALSFYRSRGITAKRLMTDKAWIYVKSRAMRQLLAKHQIRHLTTKPYRPPHQRRTRGTRSTAASNTTTQAA